jgi:hypothetical protein
VSEPTIKPKWIELINESVHTSDDIDIGDIDAVNKDKTFDTANCATMFKRFIIEK